MTCSLCKAPDPRWTQHAPWTPQGTRRLCDACAERCTQSIDRHIAQLEDRRPAAHRDEPTLLGPAVTS